MAATGGSAVPESPARVAADAARPEYVKAWLEDLGGEIADQADALGVGPGDPDLGADLGFLDEVPGGGVLAAVDPARDVPAERLLGRADLYPVAALLVHDLPGCLAVVLGGTQVGQPGGGRMGRVALTGPLDHYSVGC